MKFTATTRNNHPTKPDHRVIEVEGTLIAAKSAAHDAFKKNFPYAEIVVHQVLAVGEPVLVARRRVCGTSWIRTADVTYEEPPKLRHLDDPFAQMSLFDKPTRNPASPCFTATAHHESAFTELDARTISTPILTRFAGDTARAPSED